MKIYLSILIVLILKFSLNFSLLSRDRNDKKYKVVCYWGSWSYYRVGNGSFTTADIDPKICTHLVYGYAKFNTNHTIGVVDPYLDISKNEGTGAYHEFNELKKNNPHLTTLIAINGNHYEHFSTVANSTEKRNIFAKSVLQFLTQYQFDGFELHWEYPGFIKGDKQNLILLLRDLRAVLENDGYVLSMAVSAQKNTMDSGYDMQQIHKYVDYISLLAFDFHDSDSDVITGPNAALGHKLNDSAIDKQLNVEFAVNYWLSGGVDPHKLILGIPIFGNTYTLNSTAINGWKATIIGPGIAGNVTKTPGLLGFNEICELLEKEGNKWLIIRDMDYKVPYLVKGNQFISFDDMISVKEKLNFLKMKGLGGAMVMSIETDDFHGKCDNGRNPLTSLVMKELNQI